MDLYYHSLSVPSSCAVMIYSLQGDQDALYTADRGSEVNVSQNPKISFFNFWFSPMTYIRLRGCYKLSVLY